jgi:long-chain acyl-CoA synthetase
MVYGEGKSYLVALITVNAASPDAKQVVRQKVDEVNRRVSSTEAIKQFAVLERDFEIAKDEITPTGKVKRDVVAKRYSNLIEELYA